MLQILSRSRSCAVLLLLGSEDEDPTTLQLHPTTLRPSSSLKTAQTPAQLPSTVDEDKHTPAQLSSTISLQSPPHSMRSISLHREPSRPSAPTPNYEDEEQPDISTEVQRSTSKTGREGLGIFTVNQSSRSRSCQSFQHDSSQHGSSSSSSNVGQPDKNVRPRSTSCINAQHGSINKEGFLIGKTIPYGQKRGQTQQASRKRNKCAYVVTLCVSLGILCAGLTALLFSTDIFMKKSIKRHSPTIDSDGDGISDGLELKLGTKPFNPDTDGDGLNDNEELINVGVETEANLQQEKSFQPTTAHIRSPTTSSRPSYQTTLTLSPHEEEAYRGSKQSKGSKSSKQIHEGVRHTNLRCSQVD